MFESKTIFSTKLRHQPVKEFKNYDIRTFSLCVEHAKLVTWLRREDTFVNRDRDRRAALLAALAKYGQSSDMMRSTLNDVLPRPQPGKAPMQYVGQLLIVDT